MNRAVSKVGLIANRQLAGVLAAAVALLAAPAAEAACYVGAYRTAAGTVHQAVITIEGELKPETTVTLSYLKGNPPEKQTRTFSGKLCQLENGLLRCKTGADTGEAGSLLGKPESALCSFTAVTSLTVVSTNNVPIEGAEIRLKSGKTEKTDAEGRAVVMTEAAHEIVVISHPHFLPLLLEQPIIGILGQHGETRQVLTAAGEPPFSKSDKPCLTPTERSTCSASRDWCEQSGGRYDPVIYPDCSISEQGCCRFAGARRGTLRIYAAEPGAFIYVEGSRIVETMTPEVPVVFHDMPEGTYRIWVRSGMKWWTGEAQVSQSGDGLIEATPQPSDPPEALAPSPELAAVVPTLLQRSPVEVTGVAGASVTFVPLSDKGTLGHCESPCQAMIGPGPYTVKITKPGFQPVLKDVRVYSTARRRLRIDLAEAWAEVSLQGDPQGAAAKLATEAGDEIAVAIDGVMRRIRGGPHKLTLSAKGFEPIDQPLAIRHGERLRLSYRLPHELGPEPTLAGTGLALLPEDEPPPLKLLVDTYDKAGWELYLVVGTGIIATLIGVPLAIAGGVQQDVPMAAIGGVSIAGGVVGIVVPPLTMLEPVIDEQAAARNQAARQAHQQALEKLEQARRHNAEVKQKLAQIKQKRDQVVERNKREGRSFRVTIEREP